MKVVRERFANDYLIFSDEFRLILETFLAELDNFDPNVAGRSEHLRKRSVMTRYHLPLLGQAQTEMKSEQGWWPLRQTVNRLIAWIGTTVNRMTAKIRTKAIWKGPTRPER